MCVSRMLINTSYYHILHGLYFVYLLLRQAYNIIFMQTAMGGPQQRSKHTLTAAN